MRPNHSIGTLREQKRSILSEGKSIEECRAKIRQELESLKQQETMTKDPSCHSLIETIELESDDGDETFQTLDCEENIFEFVYHFLGPISFTYPSPN